MLLSKKLQKMCGQKQKNMWSKLKKNTAKKTVQISVIEPIIIDFCDDDSDDDTGYHIKYNRQRKKCKNRINVTFKSMPKIFGTCVCQFIKV